MRTIRFTKGKTTGMGIQAVWAKLFVENEQKPKTKKMPDVQIAAWMLHEFADHSSKFFEDLKDWKNVQRARTRYNRGGMTGGKIPKVLSHRYGEKGNLMDPIFSGRKNVRLVKE